MDFHILIPLSPFIMAIAIVFIIQYFKSRDRKELQETLRAAIEKGHPLSREDLSMLHVVPKRKGQDIRNGMVLIAVGLGMAIVGYFVGVSSGDWRHPALGAAAIPFLIGVALLIYGIIDAKSKRMD